MFGLANWLKRGLGCMTSMGDSIVLVILDMGSGLGSGMKIQA